MHNITYIPKQDTTNTIYLLFRGDRRGVPLAEEALLFRDDRRGLRRDDGLRRGDGLRRDDGLRRGD